jgi:amino acid permease
MADTRQKIFEDDEDYRGAEGRSFFKRLLGPMGHGSYRGSILILASSMIGVGFLMLPEIGRTNGLYPMIAIVVLSLFMSAFANWQLGLGYRVSRGRTLTKIIARVKGRGSAILNILVLIVDLWVSVGATYIFGAQFAVSVIDNLKLRPSWAQETGTLANYIIIALFIICFFGSLAKSFSAMRYFTFVTSIINFLLVCLVLYQIPALSAHYRDERGAQFPLFKLNNYAFGGYCLSLFSTNNQFSVVTVFSELKMPTRRRINKVVFWSPVIPLITYVAISLGGFFTCGDKCPSIISNRSYPEGFDDTLMNIAKLSSLLCLVVANILRNQSNKNSIFELIDQWKKWREERQLAKESPHLFAQAAAADSYTQDHSAGSMNDSSADQSEEVDEGRRTSLTLLMEEVDEQPFYVNFLVQLFNCSVPAVTAILAKDHLIKFVAGCIGFLAPVFMIIYPCLITIKLYQTRQIRLSKCMYYFIWAYLFVASLGTYLALVINLITEDPEIN